MAMKISSMECDMTRKDRALLIEAMNTGLMLYVPRENRKPLAELLADQLNLEFKEHFVQACLSDIGQ